MGYALLYRGVSYDVIFADIPNMFLKLCICRVVLKLSLQFSHENPLIFTEATKAEVQSQFTKPKMSYAQLIAEALLTGTERMLTLNDIYIAINKQHPYYSLDAASGRNWQNAIRLEMLFFVTLKVSD